jgi:peptidoglycan/LPS O-acetylase OafA/YrhL
METVAMGPRRVLRVCVALAAAVALVIVAGGAEHAIEVGYQAQQERTATPAPILAEQLRGFFAAKIPAGSRVYVAGKPDDSDLWKQRIAEGLVLAGLLPVDSAAQAQYSVVITDKNGQPGVIVEAAR